MSKLTALFSPHFDERHRKADWSAQVVGLKASGLMSLPKEWTPAFAVIPMGDPNQTLDNKEAMSRVFTAGALRHALAAIFSRASQRLIIRSSASAEQIECRGW